ncbi:MAG: hypothetical protein AAF591_21780 [Verrucomicrobiota bacterium]
MNQFLYATAFIGGLAWFGGECMILSAQGSPWWFILFFLAFIVVFVVMGCLNISEAAINKFGALTSAALALGLILFTARTTIILAKLDYTGSPLGHWWPALIKIFGALVFAAVALESFRLLGNSSSHHDDAHAH